MTDVTSRSNTAEDAFVNLVLHHVSSIEGRVVIQAGHFLLLGDPQSDRCVPGICEEVEGNGQVDASYLRGVRARIGVFPLGTWRLGTRLVDQLRKKGTGAFLTTIVNDWQYLPRSRPGEATARRRLFYDRQRDPLPSYFRVLQTHGLDSAAIASIGTHRVFLSEYWLRRRLERHLKAIKRANGVGSGQLHWEKNREGNSCLMLDEPDGKKCVLECGQSDCAGEVMEMLYLCAIKGFRNVVSFVPAECERPVNEGTRRAMTLFELADFHVTNITLSCTGEQSLEEVLKQPWSLNTFHATAGPDSKIQVVATSVRG